MTVRPYIANTDQNWFDFLSAIASSNGDAPGVVDEANFWFPNATEPRLASIAPGDPVFLRLKSPVRAIAGVGYFATTCMLPLEEAWMAFGTRNGDPDCARFAARIRSYRSGRSLSRELAEPAPVPEAKQLACMILRPVEFWPESARIPWGIEDGFAPQIVAGKYEDDPVRVARLLAAVGSAGEIREQEFADRFVLPSEDERARRASGVQPVREGQAAFRLRLLDAYGNQCAVTGEHTTPVLDAAHIHPYQGPSSNHIQNGLILTKEFHALFDRGYVTVTPDYRVRVSPLLRADFRNGRRYYPYDGQPLAKLPQAAAAMPSREALAWHGASVFKAG